MSIEVKSLVKKYGSQLAVDHISFSVGKAEIVGFLGPNGAGKSTTMKMMTGYLKPDEGELSICGVDVLADPIEARKYIGYLPESNPLYYDMYIAEFLHFIGGVYGLDQRQKRVKRLIEITGLGPEQNKTIGQLSKGYKQRVGLAHALIHDPEVLILDEPTSGLDPNQLEEIRQLIRKVGEEKTVLFSTHIMQEVEALCDRAIIINHGKIVADDRLDILRHAASGWERLRIRFDRPVDWTMLARIDGVKEVREEHSSVFVLDCEIGKDVRSGVFALATEHNRKILELNAMDSGMEEIFRKLTKDAGI